MSYFVINMQHEYTDKMVTPWGGMKEIKMLIDKTGISKKLAELGLPESKSNNHKTPSVIGAWQSRPNV
jgi:hypothetical protein